MDYSAPYRAPLRTLVDLLRHRAEQQPEQRVYTFLADGEADERHLTVAALLEQALTIAGALQQVAPPGARALLLYPPGLAYVAAFFGCMCAGVIAVPLYPPKASRMQRDAERIRIILDDAQPQVILSTAAIIADAAPVLSAYVGDQPLHWLATDTLTEDWAGQWHAPVLDAKSIAFLQYTSGSTAAPKGVVLSHANLIENSEQIQRCFANTTTSHGVIWLPPYHDMGLIGGILQPLYVGCSVTLLSPSDFLQRPIRWLQAISRTEATTSGGPNFAYALCARKITPEQCAALDLRSWRVAFNGAEPISADTLAAFTAAFAPAGFHPRAFVPCYGLAEATLIVSAGRLDTTPTLRQPADSGSAPLVSCGGELPAHQIRIVDPASGQVCPHEQVGEIWVAGPSVAQGYWNKPEVSAATFGVRLADGSGPFLRTGDLGLLHEGELFVTGRIKDLIIIRGRNYYPQDIERTVEQCTQAAQSGAGAAFSVTIDNLERLVVVQEVVRQQRHQPLDAVAAEISRAVALQHEVVPDAVVLLKPGSIPKTSSGKIQRYACREAYLAGTLSVIGSRVIAEAPGAAPRIWSREELLALDPDQRAAEIQRAVRAQIARSLRIEVARLDPAEPLLTLGFDSLMATEAQHQIEAMLGLHLPLSKLLSELSIDQLVAALMVALDQPGQAVEPLSAAPLADDLVMPLSYGQRALWFLHQIAPDSAAYHIASVLRATGPIDAAALQRALDRLIECHSALRTIFTVQDGEPCQQVLPYANVFLDMIAAENWSAATLEQQIDATLSQPFQPEYGPLLRVALLTRGAGETHLVLVVHHLIADFWSLAVLARDLDRCYRIERGEALPLLPPALSYRAYVDWQAALLASPRGAELWRYWEARLAGDLPALELPTDRPRPAVQTFNGATVSMVLDGPLTAQLRQFSREQGVTLYMLLLAGFQIVLGRSSGSADVLVGSPVSGRSHPMFAELVGYFINPVVLRANLAGNPSLPAFLEQVRRTVLEAFAHQDFPFALLAERLQPARDPSRSPIFQAMFIFQQVPAFADPALPLFGMGLPGGQLSLGGVTFESTTLPLRTAQFDVTLVMAEVGGQLHASLHYNTDLFEAATMARLLEHLVVLLRQMPARPTACIGDLELLTEAERHQQLVAWNQTALQVGPQGATACIHTLFEEQVARTPTATALVFRGQEMSYAELNAHANQLAHQLRGCGVGPDVPVGICVARSPALVIGLLAILKAGGAYVPLDPAYPIERLAFMLRDSGALVLVTQRSLAGRLPSQSIMLVDVDGEPATACGSIPAPASGVTTENLAYVIYTSGSTGVSKGVMVQHDSVAHFFAAMDRTVGCGADDTLLAVTSVSFDISVLELFWTLTRGARVVLASEDAIGPIRTTARTTSRPVAFSLFYFAQAAQDDADESYRLVTEGARFADQHGFSAIWTPERHFHAFGGLYPNPAVMSAALAALTSRIQIRAGSVVLPLHDPIRVAEDWALIDRLSGGRAGIAFASGWHADDFVFFPDRYSDRKAQMYEAITTVQQLWAGETVLRQGGAGNLVPIRIFPRPIQPRLPIWITAAGEPTTFQQAGRLGAGVLTHLLGQSIEDLAGKIRLYRESLHAAGHDPAAGHVTLMLHTFLGDDRDAVREQVREPFTSYLRSSVSLIENLIRSLNLPLDLQSMEAQDMDALLRFAFDRYFETSALFGTRADGALLVERLAAIGVDEIACLIDFGVATETVLASLTHLAALKDLVGGTIAPGDDDTLPALATRYGATILQCTPSLIQMLLLDERSIPALQSLHTLLLGGEALPPALAQQVTAQLPARLINMYGPTETTIWSATHPVDPQPRTVPIGRPIDGTQIYILDAQLQPLPIGVVGELYIGGCGITRGYLGRPDLTADRFVPNPFAQERLEIRDWRLSGAQSPISNLQSPISDRLYKTGDLARYRHDGTIEFVGRIDQQIKLRGFRIELGEIEVVLGQHPAVRDAAVVVRNDSAGDAQLVAYIVPRDWRLEIGDSSGDNLQSPISNLPQELRDFLASRLPAYMVPGLFVELPELPLTANGKIDRKQLPAPASARPRGAQAAVAPRSVLERRIAQVWQQVLQVEQIGVYDNFFDLGGHSLLLAQVKNQLQTTLQRDVPLVTLLQHPTISALAAYLGQHEADEPSFQQSTERAMRQLASRRRRSATQYSDER